MFNARPLWEVSRELSAVAQGRKAADSVITGATLISVCTGEILPDTDVAIAQGRIALVGNATHCIGSETKVIEAKGRYIAPGFLDGHIHVESSMLSVGQYAKAVIPHGTTGIYMDPHEICNVLGLKAVACMAKDAQGTPLKAMITTPSCVPGVPGFEDTGASIDANDIAESMKWDSVVGLGEMMNMPGILASSEQTHGIVAETLKAGKIATGHYSLPETGKGLNAYIAAGMRCCHESVRAEDALAKMRLGMYAMVREGSAWHDLKTVIKCITMSEIDSRFCVLVSDDAHPHTLIAKGHMDYIARMAIGEGVDPVTAIQMITLNCAQCFRMDHEIGSITPGKCADIVFLESLEDVKVTKVLINGQIVSEDGELTAKIKQYDYPAWAIDTIKIRDEITAASFKIKTDRETATVRVIEVMPGRADNKETSAVMQAKDGSLNADPENDILKAAVFERHHKTGTVGYGFIKGFGIKNGAMASTVSHDAHNLLVVGSNDEDMALAANTLIEQGGGKIVVCDGKVLGCVPLPIAGLMSDKEAAEMSELVAKLEDAWEELGCKLPSPFITMAAIPLACIPQLRLTNRGLIDCTKFELVDLVAEC